MFDLLPFIIQRHCITQFTLYTGINVQTMLTSQWMFHCSTEFAGSVTLVLPSEFADSVTLVLPSEFADSVTLVLPSEFADSVTLVLPSEADAINGCMSQKHTVCYHGSSSCTCGLGTPPSVIVCRI